MAKRIKIVGDAQIKHAYNVSAHVGPNRPNGADDVMLVQFFLAELLPKRRTNRGVVGGLAVPAVTGKFDSTTAYWIFEVQFQKQGVQAGAEIDGIVSPIARASLNYSETAQWTIGTLNTLFAKDFPERYERLHEEPRLSPTLRAAIAPK